MMVVAIMIAISYYCHYRAQLASVQRCDRHNRLYSQARIGRNLASRVSAMIVGSARKT